MDQNPTPPAQTNRVVGEPPLFDPQAGATVVEPLGDGPGWWVGAPSALWTGEEFYISYRVRCPQPERGAETRIAHSADGLHVTTLWSARKEQFASPSIERCALVRIADTQWRLYVSYVDGDDGRWRIDVLEAMSPAAFDPARRRPVLTAAAIGAEGVKDPWICRVGGEWLMLASYAPSPPGAVDSATLHRAGDVYNTGHTKSLTGLASSVDGLTWRWEGSVFEPSTGGWDTYAARIGTVIRREPLWLGFYDGSASVAENYEERCGLASSHDLRSWRRVGGGPAIGPNGGPGSVRYVEAVQTPRWIRYYYEWTRHDGAHELRTSRVDLPAPSPNQTP